MMTAVPKQKSVDECTEQETERRFKGALNRMLRTAHKAQAPIGKNKAGRESAAGLQGKNSVPPNRSLFFIADWYREPA